MSIIGWLVFGAIGALVGRIASKKIKIESVMGPIEFILVGMLGSMLGGWIAKEFAIGGVSVHGLNFASILVAVASALLMLVLDELIIRRLQVVINRKF